MLTLNHVGYETDDNKEILRDINLTIQDRFVAITGPNGGGKSTLAKVIAGIYQPTSGQILLDGQDITHLKGKEKRAITRRMQMVYQDPYASLNPFFTVGEIITEGLEIHNIGESKKERMEIAYDLLNRVGLHREHANRFPHEFSGGQRQRVGLARSLAVNPEFIVCDEAISALDVSVQAQIVNMLVDFQQSMGLTYLFIAHDLSMVRYISDQTAVMYLGQLVEIGDIHEIYDHPAHPYTQGLLQAVPVADPDYEKARAGKRVMLGEVASPINPGPGCRFCSRCPRATEVCKNETPQLKNVGGTHQVACHNL